MYNLESVAADAETFRRCVAEDKPYKPLYVKIKLTWRCNLRCVMCNYWRQEREDVLTLPRLRALADELADLGCGKVHLSGGEVLLRDDLEEIIACFVARGMRVNLTTNATLLTKERAFSLIETGVRGVSVSIDSPDPHIHDRIRGKGAWKRAVKGLSYLRRAIDRLKARTRLRLNTVVSRRNFESLVSLADFAHDLGVDCLTLIPVDDETGRLYLNKERIRRYNATVAPVIASRGMAFGLLDRPEEAYPFGTEKRDWEYSKQGWYALGLYEHQPCYAPWTHSLITPRGRVYACCMTRSLPAPLGDLRRQSFTEIWAGPAYQQFRRASHHPTLEACHRCDDFLEANRFLHRLATAPTPHSASRL